MPAEPQKGFRIGVLVSGSGSNLQSIIDRLHLSDSPVEVAVVLSDNPDAYGLKRAAAAGISSAVFPMGDYPDRSQHDLAMADDLKRHGVELVVLAGYMLIVTPAFLERFPRRVINLHPSLLPAFPGATAIEDAFRCGVRVTGVTVHFVDEGVDTGPVILQEAVAIDPGDALEDLTARIHETEHRLLPEAIALIAAGRVQADGENFHRIVIK